MLSIPYCFVTEPHRGIVILDYLSIIPKQEKRRRNPLMWPRWTEDQLEKNDCSPSRWDQDGKVCRYEVLRDHEYEKLVYLLSIFRVHEEASLFIALSGHPSMMISLEIYGTVETSRGPKHLDVTGWEGAHYDCFSHLSNNLRPLLEDNKTHCAGLYYSHHPDISNGKNGKK